ncbi:lactonase family protein [Psychromonas sp. MME2]|uniref:lactonase family protein n=1 Tax=unclassified Psychromonas TaxID=2614957 RepID=UPI00339D1FFB
MTKQILYIGCYTPNAEAGIKVVEFDNKNGQLKEVGSSAMLSDPSFLVVSKDRKYLLAVSENEQQGYLGCFDIKMPITPIFINKQSSLGGAPCHISLNHKNAFVSNYMTGSVSAFSLTQDKLLPAYQSIQHTGQGRCPDRQASAHAHASQLSVDEKFLVVADLGIDALKVYDVSENQLNEVFCAYLPAGSGPRHFTFNALGDKLYLGNELSSEVSVFNFNQTTGELVHIQSISSLPQANKPLSGESQGSLENSIAEVALSLDGRYLYVSNRGHDSIAIYSVKQSNGLLTALTFTPSGGLFPRHFALSPDQQWLLVAHQKSDYLIVFKRDNESGFLTKTDEKLAVKHAVCVCFL